jgi:hypothetical protein
MAVAIFLTGDLFRECALSSRTSAFDQERRLRRLARLVVITHQSRRNWGISIDGRRRVESGEDFVALAAVRSCIKYLALDWNLLCSEPSWISARV